MQLQFCIGAMSLPGHLHIPIGERHPSHSGFISGTARVDEGVWHDVELRPGYGHRGAEKLFEVRDYRAAIMLADRHDWLSAFSGELVVTMTIERAMGLQAPRRAILLRTLLAELGRIHSHLSFLSVVPDEALRARLWDVVDALREALLAWSGNRVHPMLNRVGGLAANPPTDWRPPLDDVRRLHDALARALAGTQRYRGLAVLDALDCAQYGLSGPVARAADLANDRRAEGLLAYDEVFRPVPLRTDGDGQARLEVLVDELLASADMVDDLLSLAADAPEVIDVRLARRLKVPEGEHWAEVEAPWGVAGSLLVSRGGATPWRLSLRTPSFANLSALGRALEGTPQTRIADAVATVGYSVGDVDR